MTLDRPRPICLASLGSDCLFFVAGVVSSIVCYSYPALHMWVSSADSRGRVRRLLAKPSSVLAR